MLDAFATITAFDTKYSSSQGDTSNLLLLLSVYLFLGDRLELTFYNR